VAHLRTRLGPERVGTGRFGADMQVRLVNDGPVTIELESGTGFCGCIRAAHMK
jgi:D-tyrosyl-tRNA(Tyr) deacylase